MIDARLMNVASNAAFAFSFLNFKLSQLNHDLKDILLFVFFQIVFGLFNAGLLSVWLSDHLVQG